MRSEFSAFIAGVESLRAFNEDVAKAAEPKVLAAMQETVAKGEAPDGSEWPALADGGKPLEGAAKAIKSSVKGNRIDLTVGPPYVFHNHGAGGHSDTKEAVRARKASEVRRAKSGTKSKFHAPRRQILPESGEPIPAGVNTAIEEAATTVFRKAVG